MVVMVMVNVEQMICFLPDLLLHIHLLVQQDRSRYLSLLIGERQDSGLPRL